MRHDDRLSQRVRSVAVKEDGDEEKGGEGEGEGGGGEAGVGGCEVCVYVIENKQQHQPYLCRGIKDPGQQKQVIA
jgi:hypothetical protein